MRDQQEHRQQKEADPDEEICGEFWGIDLLLVHNADNTWSGDRSANLSSRRLILQAVDIWKEQRGILVICCVVHEVHVCLAVTWGKEMHC